MLFNGIHDVATPFVVARKLQACSSFSGVFSGCLVLSNFWDLLCGHLNYRSVHFSVPCGCLLNMIVKRHSKTKIGENVPQGRLNQCAIFQHSELKC